MAKEEKKAEAKVSRNKYKVLARKNFGSGIVAIGETVELSDKAGGFYADKGFVKPLKKK